MIEGYSFLQRRVRGVLVALGILLTTVTTSASELPETGKDTSVIGEWKIISVLDYATISVGADQAKPFIGQTLIISSEQVKFGNQVCPASNFLAERVETNIELRENARVSNDNLGLPNPVTVVELSCAYAYLKDRRRIVLAWNGIFFEAVRKKKQKATIHSRPNSAG